MHGRIYQMSTEPIHESDYITEDEFIDNGFVGFVADYVSSDDIDNEEEIRDLVEYLTPYGVSYDLASRSIVFHKGFKVRYFSDRFGKLKEYVNNLTLDKFAQDTLVSFRLKQCIEDESSSYVYLDGSLYTFDYFVRQLDETKMYYLGAVLDFHI